MSRSVNAAGRSPVAGVRWHGPVWTASHDQRQCFLCTDSCTVAIAVCPQPRSGRSARSEARTNSPDGGQNVGGQLGRPVGGCEETAAITEGDRTSLGRCAIIPRRSPNQPLKNCQVQASRTAPPWSRSDGSSPRLMTYWRLGHPDGPK